ncbi:MAG: hypothetical protein U0R24_01995 [Solirubrobacterales bacterium]|mgnify:CR=1 FL=1
MRTGLKAPSPGLVMGVIALIVAMSGVAFAAGKIGGKDIESGAVKASKIKDGAVKEKKLANGAVTADKIGAGAVGNGALADGAVTTSKLDPSERSEAFTAKHLQVNLPGGVDTVAIQTTLPTGNFAVTVSGEVGNSSSAVNSIECDLLDANNPLAESLSATTASNTFQDTISLTGVTDGGVVRLSCNPDGGAAIRAMVLTAVRVGSVTSLESTP